MVEKFPEWDAQDKNGSIQKIFQWTIKNCENQIAWYDYKRRIKRFGSRIIRIISSIFLGIGIICPLIQFIEIKNFQFGQLGYIAFAIAGIVFLFDKYFGLSSGWMRFMETQLNLEKALKEFYYDWTTTNTEKSSDNNILKLLQKLKDFTSKVENYVIEETNAWSIEFESNLSRLEKLIKKEKKV